MNLTEDLQLQPAQPLYYRTRRTQTHMHLHETFEITEHVADLDPPSLGNNYAIYNESKRHTAKIFFSQGCETDSGLDEAGPA